MVSKDDFGGMVARIKEIDAIVRDLDESIRAAAFDVLRPYADGQVSPLRVEKTASVSLDDAAEFDAAENSDSGAREFIGRYVSDRPADNVKMIAAYIYSQYGISSFTAQEINDIANEAGVTVPRRVDVTLSGAAEKKKLLFTKARSGVYRPTVHAEQYFRDTYGVSKGTKKREAET